MANKPESEPQYKKMKEKATKFFAKGKWDQALELYLQLWKMAPKDFRLQLKIGDILLKLDRKKEAIAVYKKVAEAYGKDGFLIQAISVCKIVLELDPKEMEIKNLLSSLYAKRGMFKDSVKATSHTSSSKPEEKQVHSDELLDEFFSENIEITKGELPEIPLFSHLEKNAFQALIDSLNPWRVPKGTVICQEGSAADSMFIISNGTIKVTTRGPKGETIELAYLGSGEFFGEIGLFTSSNRTATCTADEETDLLEIKRISFDQIVRRFPQVKQVLHDFYKVRILDTILAKSELFGCFPYEIRRELMERFEPREYESQETIVSEGDEGICMYMIRDGQVEVFTKNDDQGEVHLTTLGAGEFFGEVALISKTKRTAYIRADGHCDILQLNRKDFDWAMQKSPEALKVVKIYVEKRVKGTIEAVS